MINGWSSDPKERVYLEYSYRSPIYSVAIDPAYRLPNRKSFVCGGKAGALTRNVKGTNFLI